MADSNETQLLSDLLRDIAREDARLDAPHLEARVMDVSASARSIGPDIGASGLMQWAIAAGAAIAVLVPALLWMKAGVPVEKVHLGEIHADVPAEPAGPAEAERPAKADAPAKTGRDEPPRASRIAPSPITPSPITQSRIAESTVVQPPIAELPLAQSAITQPRDEFLPLMPMTERELTGPFQIVRVQMPRASLGALRSPLEHPNELVEADVLLGEDGMARAIRLSTSGTVYPWRSR
jgi:hypothetical protein